MTARPAKSKNERMLQSLLVEVCGKEAKAVIRAAMRVFNEDGGINYTDWYDHETGTQAALMRACARYTRAKARAKGK